ncbi:MAG: hypothetical protein ACOH2J_10625 [Allorhizobium sp.]
MTVFAPTSLGVRQMLVRGKVSQAVTGRVFDDFTIGLSYTNAAGQGKLPVGLQRKSGGYYALHLDPIRAMPDLSQDGAVTLILSVTLPGRAPLVVQKTIGASEFARVAKPVTIGQQTLVAFVLAGAPLVFDVVLPASPVGLRGIVLEKHDPEAPLAGVKIRAGNAPEVISGANGRFAIDALPVTETVSIELEGAGPVETVDFRPDYEIPVNTITLSLGS